MDYQSTLKYLYESAPMFQQVGGKAYKPGLMTTHKLDEHFGHPHRLFKTIHVAGTNGKGSCSHSIAAVLQAAGYRVGLYTSPHLIDFRERIRINGEMIPEEYVIRFVEEHRSFFEPLHPSFFELTTAMAFRYFADQQIEVAVIETGMGGRLDCTNIITPVLCVITNISLDHTQYLGDTLTKIAREKAGIIKEGVPVIVGRASGYVKRVFNSKAQKMNAPIIYTESLKANSLLSWESLEDLKENREAIKEESEELKGYQIVLEKDLSKKTGKPLGDAGLNNLIRVLNKLIKEKKSAYFVMVPREFEQEFYFELSGSYQAENIFTIIQALRHLRHMGYCLNERHFLIGLSSVCEMTGLMGRWQKVHSYPDIICDTGHNVDGIQSICQQFKAIIRNEEDKHLHIVFGMVNDKDISGVLQLLPKDATYYFTKASVQRALPEDELLRQAEAAGLKGISYPTVVEAVQAAKEKCLPTDLIFVGGSTFVVADLLANRDTLNLD